MSTLAAALRPIPIPIGRTCFAAILVVQAFMLLRIAFTVAPILFGLDKFAEVLFDNWPALSGAPVQRHHSRQRPGCDVHGRRRRDRRRPVVLVAPRFGGLLVAGWLAGIIVSLLLVGGYGDIALRDFGLLLGALALSRLASAYSERVPETR